MKRIRVKLAERSYDIIIGKNITANKIEELDEIIQDKKVLAVSDTNVSELYSDRINKIIGNLEFSIFKAGEASKTLNTMGSIYHDAVINGLNRKSFIAGFGGGVPGDIAGFAAATYMRGIRFLQFPTSLLAMVDSSVGGKTGVDLPEGKNLVGAFWQPEIVVIDTIFLKTLPKRELLCGLAEIIKYAVILDKELFELLENNIDKLLNLDLEFYAEIIGICCAIKARVVAEDEKENGIRALLNYGHTFGHALETEAGYEAIQHGEGVAIGMSMAAELATKIGMMSKEDAIRQDNLIKAVGLPTTFAELAPENILKNMGSDKKKIGDATTLILSDKIGSASVINSVSKEDILSAITSRKE